MSISVTADWIAKPLGDIANIVRGASPRPIASSRWFDEHSDVGWVRIGDLARSDGRTLKSTTQHLSNEGIARSRYLEPGTLILSIAATVGVPIVTGIPTCIHDGFVAIQDLKGVDETYLLYVLKMLRGELQTSGQTGSQSNVNTTLVSRLQVPVPPIKLQRVIGEALSDTDDLIAALERMIAKKQAIKQGMMQQLLTGRTRLPGFTEPWCEVRLEDVGVFLKGRGVKRDDVRPSGVPCIRYGELYTDFANYAETTRSFVNQAVANTALPIHTGDVLFAGTGETRAEIGKCVAYVGEMPAVAGGDIVVLRGDGFHPIYLAMLANTPEIINQKARSGQGDAVVHISSQALAAVTLELPPRAEQDAITEVLVDTDRELSRLYSRLDKAKAIKTGMMQELLTGRTRLPVEEAEA